MNSVYLIFTLFFLALQNEITAICIAFSSSDIPQTLNGEYTESSDTDLHNGVSYYKKLSCFGSEEIPLLLYLDNRGQWRIAQSFDIESGSDDLPESTSYVIKCIDKDQPKEPNQCSGWEYTECDNNECTSREATLSSTCPIYHLGNICRSSVRFSGFSEQQCSGTFSSGTTIFYKMNVDYDMYWYESNKYGELICADSYDDMTNGCSAKEIFLTFTDEISHGWNAPPCTGDEEPWTPYSDPDIPPTTTQKRRLLEFA